MRTCDIDGCNKAHRARGLCVTHYNQRMLTVEQRHPRVTKPCTACGALVERLPGDRYAAVACSPTCRNVIEYGQPAANAYDWAAMSMARAKQAGSPVVEYVDREVVFDRDALVCYLCHVVTMPGAGFTGRAATVDHVTPLSKGGHHTYDNVRTCCLSCNSSKRDTDISPAA